ncbi:MAG: TolC family protein, partial [Bacteroidota bacterium]
MKTILYILLFTFGISTVDAQINPLKQSQSLTLKECLDLAIKHSPALRINTLEQVKLGYRYKESMGAGLPHLNMSGSFDDFVSLPTSLIPGEFFGRPGEMIPVQFGTTYNIAGGLDLSQVIYNQSWLVSLRMVKIAIEQNSLESERSKIDLIFNVAQSYYYAQISLQQMLNRKANLVNIEKLEKINQSQYRNGFIKKVDVDRVTVNKLNLLTEIDRLRVTYEQQVNMLLYFTGLDMTQELQFSDSIQSVEVVPQVKQSLDDHIDIRMIGKQKQMAFANVGLNQAAYYPSLNLIGAFNYTNQSNTMYLLGKPGYWFNTGLIGLRLQVPIFNGLQNSNRVKQSRIMIDQLAVNEENTRKVLGFQSKDATNRLLNSIQDELRQRENMGLAERVYNVSQEQYQKGISTLTDLLDAESGLSAAQTYHSLALVQMKIAELEYRKANGTLLEIIG